jgi:cysteine desulfurase/selenocysteine lyase
MSFNIDNIRKDFPILTREIQGNTLTYLDNAASSQKPFEVLDGIKKFESNDYSNVHRGLHTLSVLSTSAYEESRKTVQKFLNAKSPDEIIFTSGGTDSFNLVASSYADANLSHGDEIIITTMEHHANIVPWHFLRERKGVKIKWIDCDSNGNLDINLFERAITPKTKFISVTQMSNVLGASPDIKKIIKLSHSHGIPILIDGCQGVVHEKTDVQELDCDFYLFSGHKIYGPTGIGVLYAKSQHGVAVVI